MKERTEIEQTDFSEYEQTRAAQHEILCRLTATLVHVMNDFCRLRQCRRRLRVCSGPMQPSPHQIWKGHAQKEIGLSGKACADLPICMAHQRPEYYQIYRQAMEEVQDMQQEHADIDLLYAFVRAAAKRRPRRPALLTSNPYHPTSSGETKG